MGAETGIAWTDHTFNPWWGCTKVSPGCDHCYAESQDARYSGADPHWGKGVPRRVFGEAHWNEPLKWQKKAAGAGVIEKVFCASMADVMDDEAPDGQREKLWELIDKTPNLYWQLLTKRPHRYVRYLPQFGFKHNNVILGTTTENQEFYDVRVPYLEKARAHLDMCNDINRRDTKPVKTFISYEPALGPLSIKKYSGLGPDWVIFGGETGSGHRPVELAWAESVKAECEAEGVAFFMKQMGAFSTKQAAALIPAHMLVRQFPEVR